MWSPEIFTPCSPGEADGVPRASRCSAGRSPMVDHRTLHPVRAAAVGPLGFPPLEGRTRINSLPQLMTNRSTQTFSNTLPFLSVESLGKRIKRTHQKKRHWRQMHKKKRERETERVKLPGLPWWMSETSFLAPVCYKSTAFWCYGRKWATLTL